MSKWPPLPGPLAETGVKAKFFFLVQKQFFSSTKNANMAQCICIFLQEVLMTVDAAMVTNIFSRLPGMRNMGVAKQPHRPSIPALLFCDRRVIRYILQFCMRIMLAAASVLHSDWFCTGLGNTESMVHPATQTRHQAFQPARLTTGL